MFLGNAKVNEKIKEEINKFDKLYEPEEKILIALIGFEGGGAGKNGGDLLWKASTSLLAYIDMDKDEFINKKSRLSWLVSDNFYNEHKSWGFDFNKASIYKIKVRKIKNGESFMVIDILESDLHNNKLQDVLDFYNEDVSIDVKNLGVFNYDRNNETYESFIKWFESKINLVIYAKEDEFEEKIEILKSIIENLIKKDAQIKEFVSEKLLDLANDWAEDCEKEQFSKEEFIKGLELVQIVIEEENDILFVLEDNTDVFLGHGIFVNVSKSGVFEDAYIVG